MTKIQNLYCNRSEDQIRPESQSRMKLHGMTNDD